MKHRCILILIALFIFAAVPLRLLSAADATPSADLNDLKARLATKVAELRTTVKRAFTGTVKTVSVTSATVETPTKDIKIELNDQLSVAQIIGGKRTALSTEQIEAGDRLTVFGSYDETLDLMTPSFIFIEPAITLAHESGIVSAIDEKGFTITLKTAEGRDVVIDIEKTTKTSSWDRTNGIVKSGFSKLAVGDTVHATGTTVAKTGHIKATRVLTLGDLTGKRPTPTETVDLEASSGSATRP